MTSAPALSFRIGRSRIVRLALLAIMFAAIAAPIATGLPDWAKAIVALAAGWLGARAWRKLEDEGEGSVVSRDGDGAWTLDAEPATLVDHAIVGPLVTLRFGVAGSTRNLCVAADAVDADSFRRLVVHLRSVHRPEAAVR